jgi:PadR family transcriptional regulator, regulatory protein PadR
MLAIDHQYRISIGDFLPTQRTELLQGTLDMLILKVLILAPLHGVGIADRIEQVTQGTFRVGPGSLFPALHRMEEKGWLKSSWSETSAGRRARFYALTAAGRRRLETETQRWNQITVAVQRALDMA